MGLLLIDNPWTSTSIIPPNTETASRQNVSAYSSGRYKYKSVEVLDYPLISKRFYVYVLVKTVLSHRHIVFMFTGTKLVLFLRITKYGV